MATRTSQFLLVLCFGIASTCFAQAPTWTEKNSPNHPLAGYYSSMVYDSAHSEIVLFGGTFSDFTPSNETWTWNGSTWTKQTPANSPPARVGFAMAYDATRGQVVIFGGVGVRGAPGADANGFFTDTWVWDGTDWTQKANGPGPLLHVPMVYDAARQEVVLYGGSVGSPNPLGDTWVWNGTTWTQKFPATSPGPRASHRLAYDAGRGRVVMFGGSGSGDQPIADTWEWDGTTWTQKFPVTSPSGRNASSLAYDAGRQRVVLFSGTLGTSIPVDNATWEWDGTNWTPASPATSPAGRGGSAMHYDVVRGQVVLFGGVDGALVVVYTDTWVYGAPAPTYTTQIAPPIDSDGSSVFSFRRGVIPVKFSLIADGVPTCTLPPATISLFRTSGASPGFINESDYVSPADSGSNFRIADCQFVYNLNAKLLGPGTYRVKININSVEAGSATFGIN